MTYNRNIVFGAACVAIFLFGISLIVLGSTLPVLREAFRLEESQMGTLASFLPAGILLGSLIFGPLVDRYSYRIVLVVSVLITMMGFLTLAYTALYLVLKIAFLLIGFGGGLLNGAGNAAVSDLSEDFDEDKGANLSLMGVFFGLGALGMPVLLGALSDTFTQKQILAGVGASMIIPAIYLLVIRYPQPKHNEKLTLSSLMKLVNSPLLILLSMVLFFQSGWESLVNNWFTTYLIDSFQIPGKEALFLLTLFAAVFTASRLLLGLLLRKLPSLVVMVFASIIAITGSTFLSIGGNYWVLIPAIVFLGTGLAAGFPVILGFVGDIFPKRSGTAFSIALTIALIGNITINYGFGMISKDLGTGIMPIALASTGLLTLLFLIISKRKSKNVST